jgi:hypothetical protein
MVEQASRVRPYVKPEAAGGGGRQDRLYMSALREDDRNELLLEAPTWRRAVPVCHAASKITDRKLKPPVVSKSLTRSALFSKSSASNNLVRRIYA